jgi:hypothetical protein
MAGKKYKNTGHGDALLIFNRPSHIQFCSWDSYNLFKEEALLCFFVYDLGIGKIISLHRASRLITRDSINGHKNTKKS